MGCCQKDSNLMTFDDYQIKAASTAIYPKEFGLIYTAMGLAVEVGEVLGKLAKVFRDANGVIDDEVKQKIIFELGDTQWFLAQLCTELGVSLNGVAETNLFKLALRKKNNTLSGSGDEP